MVRFIEDLAVVFKCKKMYNEIAKIKTQRMIYHTDPVGSPDAEEDKSIISAFQAERVRWARCAEHR